jgi:transcriptional regulator with XRE-family HTH domain
VPEIQHTQEFIKSKLSDGNDVREDPDQIVLEVGRRVAELRRGGGMSQSQLAQKLGITPQSIQNIERGIQNLTLRTMVKLAAALEVPLLDLVEIPEALKERRLRSAKK